MLGLAEGSGHLAEMEDGLEWPDLFQQPVGQLLAGADRKAGNVVDRLLRIKLGALAAWPVENVDHMRFQLRQPELKHGEQPNWASANNNDIGGRAVSRHRFSRQVTPRLEGEFSGNSFRLVGTEIEKKQNRSYDRRLEEIFCVNGLGANARLPKVGARAKFVHS
jgi:hypothetical protein